jgi:PAS domain S-box-containing protein
MLRNVPKLAILLVALGLAAPLINSGLVPEIVDSIYGTLIPWIGLLAVVAGIRRHRPQHGVWPLLVACVAFSAVATLLPTVVGEGSRATSPVLGDALLLLSSLLFTVALLRMLVARERRLFVGLDVLTIVIAVGLVAGDLLIGPAFGASTVPVAIRLTLLAHAVVGVVLLSAVVHLLLGRRPLLPATRLIAAAAVAFVASEVLWNLLTISGSYAPGAWADTGWNLQPLLLGLAALQPSMRRLGERREGDDADPHHGTVIVLGLAALVSPLLIGAPDLEENLGYVLNAWIGGCAVSILVVTRFSMLLRRSRSLAAALDVELAERERRLVRSEERYRQLVEQIPAVIYEAHVDRDGRVGWQYMSPQCTTILGLDADALYEDPDGWWSCVHEEDRAAVEAALTSRAVASPPVATEFRFTRPDGEEIWLRDTPARVQEDGAGIQIQGLVSDVSEARHADSERERMELELRLAQKLEAVGQLAAGIAHEINTPIQFVGDSVGFLRGAFGDLMTLVGVYGELKRGSEHGAPAPELVQRVADAEIDADVEYLTERVPTALDRTADGVQRVATIVRAMREFGHPPSAVLTPVDLNDAIQNTLVVAASEYKYVADVICDFGELPSVVCNRGDINQALLNLIVNASHAMTEVIGDTGTRGTISIRTAVQDDSVRISVSDTGTGIPAEIAERIYDPFFTTKAVGRGTGQGLAITRSIIERHNGTIYFDTVQGEGTTFHIILPTLGRAPEHEPQRITA